MRGIMCSSRPVQQQQANSGSGKVASIQYPCLHANIVSMQHPCQQAGHPNITSKTPAVTRKITTAGND